VADTHGFETVVEAGAAVLRKVLRAAWKSAECPDAPGDEGRIPEYIDLPPPDVEFGGYRVVDGQIQLPQDELDARLAAGVGADLDFGLHMQFEIGDPPVPSAGMLDMTATVTARAPIDTGEDGRQVFIFLDRVARGDVSAVLTSGHPLDPKLDQLLEEFVHGAYENDGTDPTFPSIPHVISETNVVWSFGFGAVTVDVYAELYDDESDPGHRIEVTRPNPGTIEISIPVYLRIFNIRKSGAAAGLDLRSPMGIETRLVLTAPFESAPGSYTARLSDATAAVGTIQPSPHPPEGDNYLHNRTAIPLVSLDDLLEQELVERGESLAQEIGDFTIEVPTVAEIETAIEDLFHPELAGRGQVPVWTPADSEEFAILDVTVNVRADALVIAINRADGADVAAIDAFIPADREFAIAVDGAKVIQLVDQARADEGLADSDLPTRLEADGKDVDLRELDVGLTDGSLRVTGAVTVIDAVAGSIDIDADFTADIGLHWEPNAALNAEGVQALRHHSIGEPDVDVDAGWLLALILGLLGLVTGGLLGALIGVIVALIIVAIASSIGSSIAEDAVSGLPIGLGAWPSELARVGTVRAVFHDPVVIESNGIVIAGTLEVISSCEATAIVPADSGLTYAATPAVPITLSAGNTHPAATYTWAPGDGTPPAGVQDFAHSYVASGLYVAKHRVTVTQAGGATSRHFAFVDVENVPPTVDAGPDLVVEEGEVVTLVGHFWDVEYPDTHESTWNFGDDQKPEPGVVQETNEAPQASGTSTVEHAWCDNGVYTVTLRVRDQNGGTETDTRQVTVLNVPPEVNAGPDRFAYPCMPITLRADFEDPGWCDTHRGSWDFGDCSPVQTAIVRETNAAPAAKGTSSAAHVYRTCGTYRAAAAVVDDDGGVGVAATTVDVVTIANAGFEDGFHPLIAGRVANAWRPYLATGTDLQTTAAGLASVAVRFPQVSKQLYECEQCVVHGGQRAQRILAPAGARVGIFQRLGANPRWRYQVSAFYSLHEAFGGSVRLGIDPDGGDDAGSAAVVWSVGSETGEWFQLTEEVVARAEAITIFLELEAESERIVDGCFDDVEFVAFEPHCPPEKPEEPEEPERRQRRCARFERRPPAATYSEAGFVFTNRSSEPVHVVAFGPPPGEVKLALGVGGLLADIPFPAEWVVARVAYGGGKPPELVALDAGGAVVASVAGGTDQSQLQVLRADAPGIVRVVLTAQEGGLYELCAGTGRARRRRETAEVATGSDVEVVLRSLPDPTGYRIDREDGKATSGLTARPTHVEIPAAAWRKFDAELQRAVKREQATMSTELPVLITVRPAELEERPSSLRGAELAAIRAAAFEDETRDLVRELRERGARDVRPLWIARAVAAQLPLRAAVGAALRDDTVQVSLVIERNALA
jgi:hypothetical protein